MFRADLICNEKFALIVSRPRSRLGPSLGTGLYASIFSGRPFMPLSIDESKQPSECDVRAASVSTKKTIFFRNQQIEIETYCIFEGFCVVLEAAAMGSSISVDASGVPGTAYTSCLLLPRH